jgi:hypothetical protein
MILEGIAAKQYYQNKNYEVDDYSENGLDVVASVMIALLILFLYLFLVFVSVYTAYQCNKNNPPWMFVNLLVSVFFPGLYLLVHPNLMLAHSGPKSYCDS